VTSSRSDRTAWPVRIRPCDAEASAPGSRRGHQRSSTCVQGCSESSPRSSAQPVPEPAGVAERLAPLPRVDRPAGGRGVLQPLLVRADPAVEPVRTAHPHQRVGGHRPVVGQPAVELGAGPVAGVRAPRRGGTSSCAQPTTSRPLEVKSVGSRVSPVEELLTIGEVAQPSRAVRADRALLRVPRPAQLGPHGGQPAAVRPPRLRRLAFVAAAQRVGLSLDEIAAALGTLPRTGRRPAGSGPASARAGGTGWRTASRSCRRCRTPWTAASAAAACPCSAAPCTTPETPRRGGDGITVAPSGTGRRAAPARRLAQARVR
jgi:hypothetical protein